MSSGRLSEDGKTFAFELSSTHTVAHFMLSHIDGIESNPDKILMRMDTNVNHFGSSINATNSIVIDKNKARVLSRIFKHAAEVMDKWFEEENER